MVKDSFKFYLELMTVIVKRLDRGCLDNLTNYYRFVGKGDFAKFVHGLSICWVNIRCRLFIVSNPPDLHLSNTFEI